MPSTNCIKVRESDPSADTLSALYRVNLMSISEISARLSVPKSRVRLLLLFYGIGTRSGREAQKIAKPKISAARTGVKRKPFSKEWRQAISESMLKRSSNYAVGVSIKPSGYAEYTKGPHKGRSVHVVLMEQKIGRRLRRGECVHHIDENKLNNSLDNLALMTIAEHARVHRLLEASNGAKRKRSKDGKFE